MSTTLKNQNTSNSQKLPLSEINTLEENKSKNQIPALDGVRAIACLGVLLSHLTAIAVGTGIWGPVHAIHDIPGVLDYFALSLSNGGYTGIYLFFILSGFLLFLPYAKALLFESPWPGLRRFYLRRIFRILPGYYATLLLLILFLHSVFLHSSHWYYLWLFLTLQINTSLAGQLDGVFWTLAIEVQFYLILPILVWLFGLIVCRGSTNWHMFKLTFCLLLMTAWGLLTRYWGFYLADTAKLDFLIPHRISVALKPLIYGDQGKYLEVFAIGMLMCALYTYMQNAPSAQYWSMRMRQLSPLLLTVGLAILFFLFFWDFYFTDINVYNNTLLARHIKYTKYPVIFTFLDPHIPPIVSLYFPEWQTLGYALGYGCCLLAVLYGSVRLKRVLEGVVLRWVALISFSLYMWHQQLMYLFKDVLLFHIQQQHLGHLVEYAALWCWTLIIILPVSAMPYYWIEKPGMHLGEQIIQKLNLNNRKL
ncbi:MAG TPA: acyltransferase [Ktedonobacteraceae bacterium]